MSFLPQTGCTQCNDCEANIEVVGGEQTRNSEYYISDGAQLSGKAIAESLACCFRWVCAQNQINNGTDPKPTPPRGEAGWVFWFKLNGNSEPLTFYLAQTTSTENCCALQCFCLLCKETASQAENLQLQKMWTAAQCDTDD